MQLSMLEFSQKQKLTNGIFHFLTRIQTAELGLPLILKGNKCKRSPQAFNLRATFVLSSIIAHFINRFMLINER